MPLLVSTFKLNLPDRGSQDSPNLNKLTSGLCHPTCHLSSHFLAHLKVHMFTLHTLTLTIIITMDLMSLVHLNLNSLLNHNQQLQLDKVRSSNFLTRPFMVLA